MGYYNVHYTDYYTCHAGTYAVVFDDFSQI